MFRKEGRNNTVTTQEVEGKESGQDWSWMTLTKEYQAETMGLIPISESLPPEVPQLKRIHWVLVKLPEHIDLGGKFELDFPVRPRKPRLNHAKQTNANVQPLKVGSSGKKGKREQICWIAAKRDQSIQIALKPLIKTH
eukprot:120943_1